MSATNFYQSFYQNDQLFRLKNELWATENQPVLADPLSVDETSAPATKPAAPTDLLTELDALSTGSSLSIGESSTASAEILDRTTTQEPDEETPVFVPAPEPLPQSVARSSTPPIIPAVQQPVRPQLNHKVLILADEELDPSNLLFLEKILKAINLNIDGVDLLNLHGAGDLDFAALVETKKIHHFITFGVPFKRIHLDIAMDRYHPIRFFGITFLMADSLPTIEADLNLKKRLWGALQRVFLQQQ
ncbi:hypothetical protein WBJ53_15260 [Spirosoma sp. SC4-14]|uniref:hypothetical protein n=1 Tax=Spirosoma sp. SC4-14 TaxID=3128900 RepID=UPI0030D3624E